MQEDPAAKQLRVERPSRDADRNQPLADRTDSATERILLPTLNDGITLLDIEDGRGVPVLQSLVLDYLLLHDGAAFWIDANGYATTLAQIAPSRRLLNRIHVARGFTAYQHYTAVADLSTIIGQPLRNGSSADNESQFPSLIVAPAVDARYRTGDTLVRIPRVVL